MITESTTIRGTRPEHHAGTNGAGHKDAGHRVEEARAALGAAASQVGDAVDAARATIPEVARVSRAAVSDAMTRIEAGSDEQVTAGATLSLGLAIGMLLGGAPRLLVALALLLLTAMGAVVLDRHSRSGLAGSSSMRS